MTKGYAGIKFVLDRLGAAVAIAVLLPVLVCTALLVALDGKGKIIFRQVRVGHKGKFFKIYKFRTMRTVNVDFCVTKAVIEEDNNNVTWVGGFLRRYKLDELPQLFNVLKGDMSFVGPRPLLPVYLGVYESWEYCKFRVRPGLTGLAQTSGNGHLSVPERSYYDVYYTEKVYFRLDFEIVLDTIKTIVRGEASRKVRVHSSYINYFREKYNSCLECRYYYSKAAIQAIIYSAV